jgi:hypothetical protein
MQRRRTLEIAVPVLSGIVIGLAFSSLAGRREPAVPSDPSRAAPSSVRQHTDANGVSVSLDRQKKAGIVVAPLQAMSYRPRVQAYGTVLTTQDLSDVRITIAEARAKLDEAQAQLIASHDAYVRLQALYGEDRNVSQKSVQQAQAVWQSDEAAERAAEVACRSQEAIADQTWGLTISKWVRENSPSFMRLIEQTDVLIQITLSSGATVLSPPDSALIATPKGTTVTATFVSASPRTNPRLQGPSFFYLAPSQTSGLLPGMNVVAYLPSASEVAGVYVPDSAVVRQQGQAWVYLQISAVHFVRHAIPTDAPVRDGWFIRKDLSSEQWCVVQGAQLLLAQESRTGGPSGGED